MAQDEIERARAALSEGRLDDAEALCRSVSDEAAAHGLLGHVLRHRRRHDDALAEFERALALDPDLPGAAMDRADELQTLGRNDEAVEAYRRVLAAEPLNDRAHRQLNNLLYRLGDDANFLKSYDEAAAKFPGRPILPLGKGGFLLQVGRLDDAESCFARAAQLLPGAIAPLNGLAATFARKGDYARAIATHRRIAELAPRHADSWISYCETLLRAREATEARGAADMAVGLDPLNQGAIAFQSLAMRAQGDARDEWLNDFDSLVQVFALEPPEGFADMESFNAALAEELGTLHSGKREFLSQSLRGGTQTVNDLFTARHDLVDRLRARIDEAVGAYIARLKSDETHPLLSRKRDAFAYAASWSSRLSDCGFHTNHVHPKGWISSAYYVAVPDAANDAAAKQGWIKFGEPSFDAGLADPIRRAVQPRPGTLVLFPSYMWHGTVPFHSASHRTTIAFDVVPR
ncbi:MAG TPA: putative 2OG-Fe(II) oxygenase [Rhizomicrobium sp.]|nr:putative 2OG-Fe(II) oxygenase [Rhizomicrobium sp.]